MKKQISLCVVALTIGLAIAAAKAQTPVNTTVHSFDSFVVSRLIQTQFINRILLS